MKLILPRLIREEKIGQSAKNVVVHLVLVSNEIKKIRSS